MTKYLVAVAVASLAIYLGWRLDAPGQNVPDHRSVSPAGFRIAAQGRVEGATEEIFLRPQLLGRLVELHVRRNDYVDVGQLLLRIDDRQFRHEVSLAEADLCEAEARLEILQNGARPEERREAESEYRARLAELEQARLSWMRTEKLIASGATTAQEFDDRRTAMAAITARVEGARARLELLNAPARADEVKLAQARIDAARARLGLAQVQLQRTELRAPLAGQVLDINAEPGELAGPDSIEATIVLADIRRFRVRAFVEELDAPRVVVGMPACVTADGCDGRVYSGHVSELSPRMEPKQLFSDQPGERVDTKTREVWIELQTADDLIVGLRVDVTISPMPPDRCERLPATIEAAPSVEPTP